MKEEPRSVPAALELQFTRSRSVAIALATRILGHPSDAQDVVQEAYLQAWIAYVRFDPARGSLAAWIMTMVRSRAIDRSRGENVRAKCERATISCAQPAAAEYPLNSRALARQLHRLREAEREVLELAYSKGLTHAEIAARTGLPLGTVKTNVRRALKRLADRLGTAAR